MLSTAMHTLLVHCAAFDVVAPEALQQAKRTTAWGKNKAALTFEIESFYHEKAFIIDKKKKRSSLGKEKW